MSEPIEVRDAAAMKPTVPDACEADVKRIAAEFERPLTPHLRDMLVRAWYSGKTCPVEPGPDVAVESMARGRPSHVWADGRMLTFEQYIKHRADQPAGRRNAMPMKPTLHEQIRCVERELRMRSRVYPGLVDRRKMSPADCDRELLHMSAVLETLKHCEVLAKCLEEAPRQRIEHVEQGATIEGAAYVSISHELAKKIAAQLRGGS